MVAPPEIGVQRCGEEAIRTASKLVGYGRRVAQRKGVSGDPGAIAKRLDFAEEAIHRTKERLYIQMFINEIWAFGGTHIQEYVTVKENGGVIVIIRSA
jgi:hypothetical protein